MQRMGDSIKILETEKNSVGSIHQVGKDDILFEIDRSPDTADFIQTEPHEDVDTTVDIQLTIMNRLKIDNDFSEGTFVDKFEVIQGNLYFKVTLPNKKSVMRRQEHFQKLRNIVAVKWGSFVPIMDPFNQKTNEMKLYMMNEFLRESFKYDFIVKSKEFQATFDPT